MPVPPLFPSCLACRGALDQEAQQPFCSASFRSWTGDSCDLAEDVDPAAAPDGAERDCTAGGTSSGAAESRIWLDGVGTSAVPRARCAVAMGGRAQRHGVMVSRVVRLQVGKRECT